MSATKPSRYLFSLLLLALAQCMVGVNIVGSKWLLAHQHTPVFILLIRFIVATVLLLIADPIWRRCRVAPPRLKLRELNRRDWLFIIAQALCAGVFFNILLLWGLHYTNAGAAGIITSALPAIIVVLSILLLKERLTLLRGACILFAVLGLIVINARNISAGGGHSFAGDFIILLSLVPEALYYVLLKIHVPNLPILLMAALLNGINLPILLVWVILHGGVTSELLHISLDGVLILVSIGIASGLFCIFWLFGSRQVSSSTAGLMTAVMPIATLTMAWVLLSEHIGLFQLLGMVLVVISIVVNARGKA